MCFCFVLTLTYLCVYSSINRPGGHGRITRVHYLNNDSSGGVVQSLDVKYTVTGGSDLHLDPDLVKPHQELSRQGRSRRSRDFFAPTTTTAVSKKDNDGMKKKKKQKRSSSCPDNKMQPEILSSAANKNREKENKPHPTNRSNNAHKKKKSGKRKRKSAVKKQAKVPSRIKALRDELVIGDGIPEEIVVRHEKMGAATPVSKISPLGAGFSKTKLCKRPTSPSLRDQKTADLVDRVVDDSRSDEEADDKSSPISHTKPLATGDWYDDDAKEGTTSSVETTTTSGGPPAPRVHLTLEQVYHHEKQKATEFLDAVIAGRTVTDNDAPPRTTESSSCPVLAPPVVDERQGTFQSLLNHVLVLHESMVEEDGLVERVNALAGDMQFTSNETNQFLQTLAAQDKIMRSDGMIISI